MTREGLILGEDGRHRCWWHGGDPLYRDYHDTEWGRPTADDRRLFEKLCLEGFQAGLSWITILRKRPRFRAAFADFDWTVLAGYGEEEVRHLLGDAGIVRHRGKIEAVIGNARCMQALLEETGSLAALVWRFAPSPAARPRPLDYATARTITQTPESTALSRELRRRGWRFVGPTTVYAFMQAMGLVNDHLEGCCVREEVEAARRDFALARHQPA
ncbi:DNA-3-methyladenine glycosylase I [Geminicoccaceae bacterium 1502E]|nr:DNA-3-methyladenine glycosylase I [Geminicoccaceae bacterium 1502E]